MSLGPINTIKELSQAYQPLMLVTFTLNDGTVLNVSTHSFDTGYVGDVTYGGTIYRARIVNQNYASLQALTQQGISVTPSVTIELADADSFIYTNYEGPIGFKGATVVISFVFYDIVSQQFSDDAITKFLGIASSPKWNTKTISISAQSKLNMANISLPSLTIQKLCPWDFPTTLAQRADGLNNDQSFYFPCGYSPDQSGGVGNYQTGTTPFPSCNYSVTNCQARGMYDHDSSGTRTGSFGGIQFQPPAETISRGYLNGKWSEILNNPCNGVYGAPVPLVYGTQFVNGMVLNQWSDANYTNMYVLLCYGVPVNIFQVIVNGIVIPHYTTATSAPAGTIGAYTDQFFPEVANDVTDFRSALIIGYWSGAASGGRRGVRTYSGQGDPYGSYAVINLSVINSIAASGSIPQIQVLMTGPAVRAYTDPTDLTTFITDRTNALCVNNPVWHLADVLSWCNWDYPDLDLVSFINNASITSALIHHLDQFGNSVSLGRYLSGFTLSQTQRGSEIVGAMLNGMKAILAPNYLESGNLSLTLQQTMAEQQSSAVPGSNDNTAFASYLSDGSSASAYPAYSFDESNILTGPDGKTSTFEVDQRTFNDAPNSYNFQFQDSENSYVPGTYSPSDTEDIARMGQHFPGTLPLIGPTYFDQFQRISATEFAKNFRGNQRVAADGETIGDVGGTMWFSFEASFRAVHLQIGMIVLLSWQKLSLTNQPCRVMSVQPTVNFERVKLQIAFHNDVWWFDTFGQTGAPLWTKGSPTSPTSPRALVGSAAPLLDSAVDPVFANNIEVSSVPVCLTEIGLAPVQYAYSGGVSTAQLSLSYAVPVNQIDVTVRPPFVGLQGGTSSTGGGLPSGYMYYLALVALTANGQSALSTVCKVLPTSGFTNTLELTGLNWDVGTTGFLLYAGIHPGVLYLQSGNYSPTGGSTTPTSITVNGKLTQQGELPDTLLSKIRFKTKLEYFPGVITDFIDSASLLSGVWTIILENLSLSANPPLATNALMGRFISILGRATPSGAPIYSGFLPITASTVGGQITVTADALGVAQFEAGDQITVRISLLPMGAIGSDGGGNYIEDALFVNPNALNGLTASNLFGWLSAGLVQYSSLQYLMLRIISGTGVGTTATIASNTSTKIYIVGNWPITPDSTSVFVIENPAWATSQDTTVLTNTSSAGVVSSSIPVPASLYSASSTQGTCLLIQAVTLAADGSESTDLSAPVKEVYLLQDGQGSDRAEPPAPGYHLTTDNQGELIIEEIGFPVTQTAQTLAATLVNTSANAVFTWSIGGYYPQVGDIISVAGVLTSRAITFVDGGTSTLTMASPASSSGAVTLAVIAYTPPINISSVTSATLELVLRDLTDTSNITMLAASITTSATSLTLTAAPITAYSFGQPIQIDDELMLVSSYTSGSTTVGVIRAAYGSMAPTSTPSHALGAAIFPYQTTVYTLSFPPMFFSSPLSENFEEALALPNHVIVAAEMTATNAIGTSQANQQPFGMGGGLLTGSNGNAVVTITVDGTLGIGSNLAPRTQRGVSTQATGVSALLKYGSIGSDFTVDINVGGTLWLTLVIPAVSTSNTPSQVSATSAQVAMLTSIPAATDITVDVVLPGSTFPGSSLTIQIFA